jgi:pyridoxal phosphate enzyme (YggS family)
VAERLADVRARLRAAAARAGRPETDVTLVAVSKLQPLEAIREAYAAGQRVFGESYAQELRDKAKALADLPDLRLHFIGRLQKNKAKYVAPLAALFEALDGVDLARELDRRASSAGRVLPLLVELNLGEAQKGGVPPAGLDSLLAAVASLPSLEVRGLMCIPPQVASGEEVRPYFREVARLARERGLPTVSMGMSADFETAVEEGATLVRVGTAIFGERPAKR